MNRLKYIFACGCAGLLLTAGRGQSETVLWSDNFEANAGNRWTTNSVWQIGAPTIGPAAAHSGTSCVTTGLKSLAPANADTRLICTNYNGTNWLLIPAANQFPRLRFWQWFDFVNAGGFVEILQAGSTNWQAITATNISVGSTASYGSGVWSRPSIDLSAFGGQSVQIAFHFFSGGNGWGSDPGWYIDDVAVVTNAPVLNNPEGFEAGLGDWSVDSGTWEVGKPTSGPNAAHSGTNCAGTVLAGDYGWNVNARLISPPFPVPTSGNAALRFWQWYSFVNAGGFVEINNGTNTITVTTNTITVTNITIVTNTIITTNVFTYTNSITATNTTITTTNSITVTQNSSWQTVLQTNISVGSASLTSGGWRTNNAAIDLSAYAGQTVQLAFHFFSGGSGWGNAPGWYVDDVSLVATPTLAVPTNSLSIYAGTVLTVTNGATLYPASTPTFILLSGPTNNVALNPTNGVLIWNTTTAQAPGNYTNVIAVTDTNGFSATNSFVVSVLPPPSQPQISPANVTLSLTNGFQFSFQTVANTTWRIDATTNLLNWLPVFTNLAGSDGTFQFTDLPATNFPHRFYRAVFP
jgi:hypothetical protein